MGVVTHVPSMPEAEEQDHEFKVSLSYIAKLSLKSTQKRILILCLLTIQFRLMK